MAPCADTSLFHLYISSFTCHCISMQSPSASLIDWTMGNRRCVGLRGRHNYGLRSSTPSPLFQLVLVLMLYLSRSILDLLAGCSVYYMVFPRYGPPLQLVFICFSLSTSRHMSLFAILKSAEALMTHFVLHIVLSTYTLTSAALICRLELLSFRSFGCLWHSLYVPSP